MAARLQAMGSEKYAGTTRKSGKRHIWTGKVNVDPSAIDAPLSWKVPRRIFVNSMSDCFKRQSESTSFERYGG
jgi:protein gp37